MKLFLTLFTWAVSLSFFVCHSAHAQRAWRVNQLVTAGANFTSLQAAIDSVSNGDTLYVEPGSYGNINLNKNLKIYGVGFDVNLYDTASAHKAESAMGILTVFSGCSGSAIEGFKINDLRFPSASQNVNNLLIKRCYFTSGFYLYPFASNVAFTANNWSITQCIINSLSIGNSSSGSSVSNTLFTNCIIQNSFNISASTPGSTDFSGIVFDRNVIKTSPNNFNHNQALFSNNVINAPSLGTTGASSFNNNVFTNAQPTNPGTNTYGNTNVFGVNAADVFLLNSWTSITNSVLVTDYQLKPTSPAKNVASDGGDCGIFSGPAPMPMPPLPSNPRIYNIESDATTNPSTNQMRFRIKARSGE